MSTIVDTHVHVWDPARLHLPWLAGAGDLDRPVPEAEYRTAVAAAGAELAGAVYVEVDAAAADRAAEDALAVAMCDDPGSVFSACVLAADLAAPDAAARIAHLATLPQVRGVRHVLHVDGSPPGACLREPFVRNVRRLGEVGLLFEACVRPGEVGDVAELARRAPGTTIVLDHLGLPDPVAVAADRPTAAQRRHREAWCAGLAAVAAVPTTVCKLSGVPMAGDGDPACAAVLAEALGRFGPDRCVFAGNFPVHTGVGTLGRWIDLVDAACAPLGEDARSRVLTRTARRVYRLG